VLNNLVINASQAMPGGGTMRITAENRTLSEDSGLPLAPGPYVRFSVRDQGGGIPEEHCSRIFDPYFTTKSTGSGLGLATAYSIIKRHRGHIGVQSTAGEGSTFFFFVPALPDRAPACPTKAEGVRGGNGEVLLMDDDRAVRLVGSQMLEHLGFSVSCTSDGREAVERYREAFAQGRPYRFVILDLTVPGGTGGREALRELLALDPQVRAIVSSGYSNDPVMAEARAHGFLGVLRKPFTIEQLDSLVNSPGFRGEKVPEKTERI
jgi:CheY-like chemotaxis protein